MSSKMSDDVSDMSEATQPQPKSRSTSLNGTDGVERPTTASSRRGAMTPEERKRQKEEASAKYFKLMEKYGPKRRFLFKQQSVSGNEDEPPIEPVGFVIKFRLSHAYRALEKQEVEAAIPDIKPVRKRKHTKFLLPDDKRSDPGETATAGGSERPSSATGTVTSRADGSTKRVQVLARLRSKTQSDNKSIWQNLTKQKASQAVQQKEKQQREERVKATAGQQSKTKQKPAGGKQLQSKQKSNSNPQKSSASVAVGQKNNKKQQMLSAREQSAQTVSDKQKAIHQSLLQVKADTRERQNRKSRELWNSHFQGIGGMGLPGSVGATEYCSTADVDSVFRMFSDSMYSGSVTMDAITVSGSRPSSPSKSIIDASSRPSSASVRPSRASRKPRTSTPARGRSPSARSKTPSRPSSPSARRRTLSTASSGKGPNDTSASNKVDGRTKSRSISAILRSKSGQGKDGGEGTGKEGDMKILAPRKISKYLYHMCNCQQVARKATLAKLFKKRKVAGVIDVFGCPDDHDPRSVNLMCPFCKVVPQRRINTWLDNLEDDNFMRV